MTPSIIENLQEDNFEVLTPLEYQANRTIVLRNIDSIISTVDEEELKLDVEQRNEWIKVQEIVKIPNAPKILKIKVENAEMANTALEKGVMVYNLFVPPSAVSKDTFVRLDICFRCYSYSHKSNDCPTPTVIVCSECAEVTHSYRECRNSRKKCINCKGEHRTLAAKCPIRKKLIQEKAKTLRERSRSRSRNRNITYAQAVANNQTQQPINPQFLDRTDYVKIVSSIVYAHTIEGICPGTFHRNVEEMYKLNGLPMVKFPDYIPPPNLDPSKVEEEINKMRRQTENAQEQSEMEINIITERAKRARASTSPKEIEQKQKQRREETYEETSVEDEMQATAQPPRPSTPLKATKKEWSLPAPIRTEEEASLEEISYKNLQDRSEKHPGPTVILKSGSMNAI